MIAAWERPLVAAIVLAAFALLLFSAWRRRRLRVAFVAVTALLGALWLLALAAVQADYRDADGYADCWPSCSVLQDTVALAIWFGPALLVALALLTGLLAAITRSRGKDDHGAPKPTASHRG